MPIHSTMGSAMVEKIEKIRALMKGFMFGFI
jgi:hypothetical protein